MPKKVYLVRHGETQLGADGKYQIPETPLSHQGIAQARELAKRFRTIEIQAIYASPYQRTRQTAEIVNEVLKKPITFTDLLRERKRPTIVEQKRMDDPEVLEITKAIEQNLHDPAWRHSDEETFFDLKERAMKMLKSIEQAPAENLLLVSHVIMLKCLIMCMIFPNEASPELYRTFYHHFDMTKTGITVLEYTTRGWKLITWNDYAHLADA